MSTGGFRRTLAASAAALATLCAVALGPAGPSAADLPRGTTTPTATTSSAPTSATITIVGTFGGGRFAPRTTTVAEGGTLTVTNPTGGPHSFTSVALGPDGDPLFNVYLPAGATRTVPISTLGGGTYAFYCTIHPGMTGTLIIDGPPDGQVSDVPKFEQPLKQPPRLTGSHITLVAHQALVRVLPHGPKTPMWTYGGSFPGPTIVRRTGHDTRVTVVNHLPRSAGAISVHLHGGHQSSADDGQPMSHLIRHGARKTYDYPLVDAGQPVPGQTLWYHDHRMGVTARNNWRGLQGMFLVEDPREKHLGLPHGSHDIPLAFTDRSFTRHNRLTDPFTHSGMPMGGATTGTTGTKVLVDGRFAPYRVVEPGLYRLRLFNGSLFSSYDFALSDGRPFTQIGTGNGLLPHPVVRQDVLLGPAQRADVVVDFRKDAGQNVLLSSVPRTDGSLTGIGTRSAALMQFRVRGASTQQAHVPATLTHIPRLHVAGKPAMTWTFGMSHRHGAMYWSINGKRYNPDRVDHRVVLGTTEKWLLRNTSDITHFVHLHEELWQTLSRDGKRPPPWEQGYEDTWRLDPGESVVVAARFTDYTGDFMVHCHMLDHEDDGMMATFEVVRAAGREARAHRVGAGR